MTARHELLTSLLQTELKTLCQAKNLKITGSKSVLNDRLIQQDEILTERQARKRESVDYTGTAGLPRVTIEDRRIHSVFEKIHRNTGKSDLLHVTSRATILLSLGDERNSG